MYSTVIKLKLNIYRVNLYNISIANQDIIRYDRLFSKVFFESSSIHDKNYVFQCWNALKVLLEDSLESFDRKSKEYSTG